MTNALAVVVIQRDAQHEGGGKGTVAEWQAAMGIDWTDVRKEIAEAIPPAYTEWIGGQLMSVIGATSPMAA